MGHVTRIDADSRYYRKSRGSYWGGGDGYGDEVTERQMCAEGGTFVRRNRWRTSDVTVKRGVLVSGTALSSFSSGINYTDV